MSVTIDGTNGVTSPGGDSNTSLTSSSFVSIGNQKLGAGNATRFKNRLINGDMRISQRNGTSSVTPTSGVYSVDRFKVFCSQSSKLSFQQNAGSVTPPLGFTNYLGITSLSAYSVSSTDEFGIYQAIEGFNIADLGWGTANAKTVTLSFWVRSSLTGTFGGSLRNSDTNKSYPFSYTISSANTWEYETITITGETSGTWVTNNGVGIYLSLNLGAGSTLSTTANAWATGNYLAPTGATSVVGTNGATFYITGVQLEVGTSATGFEYVDYTTQLAMCQRYYQIIPSGTIRNDGYGGAGYNLCVTLLFPVTMRTTPTITTSWSTATNISNGPFASATVSGFNASGNTNAGGTSGILGTTTISAEL
jgi:hypothetical protein